MGGYPESMTQPMDPNSPQENPNPYGQPQYGQPQYGPPPGYSQPQQGYGQYPQQGYGPGGMMPSYMQGSGGMPGLASRWKRLGAAILDGLAIGAVVFVIALLTGDTFTGTTYATETNPYATTSGIIGIVLGLVLTALNQIVGFGERGRTIGKLALGIRVLDVTTNSPMETSGAVIRWAVATLPGSLVPVVGSIFALVDALFVFRSDKRTIHDLVAKTVVVDA